MSSYNLPAEAPRHQVFAAGRWQFADSEAIEVLPEEFEDAKVGKLPTRTIEREVKKITIAAVMSVPRIGYLDSLFHNMNVVQGVGAPLALCFGVFWHHCLSRGIQIALDNEVNYDYILTLDYDAYIPAQALKELITALAQAPEYDAMVPMLSKRGPGALVAGFEGTRNFLQPTVAIDQGHFAMTIFRREVFTKMSKPWFVESANADGDWGDGRTDSDIGFWNKAKEAGIKTGLVTKVIVGHGEEVIAWPVMENGVYRTVYQPVSEWQNTRQAPAGIGVVNA